MDFYDKYASFEIETMRKYRESRVYYQQGKTDPKQITSVDFYKAYCDRLEDFVSIDWSSLPYSGFAILKNEPPRRIIETQNDIQFEPISSITVDSWRSFFDSFKLVRNNLVHGNKLLLNLGLNDRDKDLINAATKFITFLKSYNK